MTKENQTAGVDAKLLDAAESKYDLVKLASAYVNVLKQSPDSSGWHVPQLIKKSLNEILSGTVSADEVMAAHKKRLAEGEGAAAAAPVTAGIPAVVADEKEKKDPAEKPKKKGK